MDDKLLCYIVFNKCSVILTKQTVSFNDCLLWHSDHSAQQSDIKKIKFEFIILISGKRQFCSLDIIYFLDKPCINQPLNRFIILPCPCIFINSAKSKSFIFPGQLPGNTCPYIGKSDSFCFSCIFGKIYCVS